MILRTSWPDLFGHRRHRIAPDVKVVDARDKGRAEGQQKEEIRCCVGPFLREWRRQLRADRWPVRRPLTRHSKSASASRSRGAGFNAVGRHCKPRSNFTCSNTATRSRAARLNSSSATTAASPIMRAALSRNRRRKGRHARHRHHADGAGHRAACDRGQEGDPGDEFGRLDHDNEISDFARAGFILPPQSWILAEWAGKNGSKHVVTLVNDGPRA